MNLKSPSGKGLTVNLRNARACLLLRCAARALALNLGSAAWAADAKPSGRVPLIYSSDLLHPHDDPDDHFDLVTLFCLPELDVKAILLDLGASQEKRSGRVPVEQMLKLTGRKIPYASGLTEKLKSPSDAGRGQPARAQGAVDLLLKVLRESPQSVTYIGTGSTRDLVAALNREPELLKKKLARVYVSIGNAQDGGSEWNVDLDPQAYVGLMRSGLPICWLPCMPMERANTNSLFATYWKFRQDQVLETAPQPIQNFFIYALQTVGPDELDPLKALHADLRPWRHLVWKMERNMWSTPALLHAAGRLTHRRGKTWAATAAPPAGSETVETFTFVPARVTVNDSAKTTKHLSALDSNLQIIRISAPEFYADAMRESLANLFREFPLSKR